MNNELQHHGIIGQRWGVRRYQNEDGTLTEAGKKRYRKEAEYGFQGFSKKQNSLNAASGTFLAGPLGALGASAADIGLQTWNRNSKESYDTSGKKISKEDRDDLKKHRVDLYNAMVDSRDTFSKLVAEAKAAGERKMTRQEIREFNEYFKKAYADALSEKISDYRTPSGHAVRVVNDLSRNEPMVVRFEVQADD